MQLDNLRLPIEHFSRLASGEGSPGTIQILRAAEYSRRLLLLRALVAELANAPTALNPLPPIGLAWRSLENVQSLEPRVLFDVLMTPQVGVWLSRMLRLLRSSADGKATTWTELGYMHSVALSASIRAGLDFSTEIPIVAGAAEIPTLGMVRFDNASDDHVATARSSGGQGEVRWQTDRTCIPGCREEEHRWWNLRTVTLQHQSHRLRLTLDDVTPYRNLDEPVPPCRLGDAELDRWKAQLAEAWAILVSDWPDLADAMSAGLSVVVPLPVGDGREVRSASTGDGFGAALLSPHPDPVTLAASMVHEFQHIQLGSLLHLLTLVREPAANDPNVYAPWRDDPRPVPGLLQGIYAFFGISGFWQRHRRSAPPGGKALADFEFAYARRQTAAALSTLVSSRLLTVRGQQFIRVLAGQVRGLLREPVPASARLAAWATATEHRAAWRIRHLATDTDGAQRLAHAYLAGSAPETPSIVWATPTVPDGGRWYQSRLALYRLRLARPEEFSAVATGRAPMPPQAHGARSADIALVSGDPVAAEAGYRVLLDSDPSSVAAWTGLSVTTRTSRSTPAWRLIAFHPELIRAVYHAVRQHEASVSPITVAEWLDQASPWPSRGPNHP
jgi:HEXXH motif-containing protein